MQFWLHFQYFGDVHVTWSSHVLELCTTNQRDIVTFIPSTKGKGYRAFVYINFWQGFMKLTFPHDLAVCPLCIMWN